MINTIKLRSGGRLFVLLTLCLSTVISGKAQELTLEECYRLAEENYPLTRKRELIRNSERYTLENIAHDRLPRVQLTGQAIYQSDVTHIPFSPPGMEIEQLSKDQYKIYGEVVQNLYDGGLINERKALEITRSDMDEAQLEVELYQLKDRINQLFFGILLIDEKLKQSALVKAEVKRGIQKVMTAVANGMALESELKILQAEELKIIQQMIEYRANRRAYLDMLAAFTGRDLSASTSLKKPPLRSARQEINRPELALFRYQQQSLQVRDRMISTGNRPKINLFVQGGYGRPALNMLDNDFSPYYMGGIRFNWSLNGLYTSKEERKLLDVSANLIHVQQETFLFNTQLSLTQQTAEMKKLAELMQVDEKIIALRTDIKEAASSRLTNGTITVNDYMKEVNAEDQARQQRLLHEIQLLMAHYTHKIISGN